MSDIDPTSADQAPGDVGPTSAPGVWERASESFARWRGGDPRAMDDLVRLMTPVLWHVVRAYGLERMLAEDVVQSTWLTLVRRAGDIHEPRAVAGWLTTTARREAWRVGRAQQRQHPVEDADLEPRLPVADSAEDAAQLRLRNERLWSAVASLEERCRRLLRIVACEERPDYARIAQDLAMPVGSIGPTRQRCLGKLRTALAPGEAAADGKGDPHDL